MTYNTFSSGVNTSFSTELNANRTLLHNQTQRDHLFGLDTYGDTNSIPLGIATKGFHNASVTTALEASTNLYVREFGLLADGTQDTSFTFQGINHLTAHTVTEGMPYIKHDIFGVYDLFNSGTVNTSLWTTAGTVAIESNSLKIGPTGSTASTSAVTTADLSSYKNFMVYFNLIVRRYFGTVSVTDGTTTIQVLTTDAVVGENTDLHLLWDGYHRHNIDTTNNVLLTHAVYRERFYDDADPTQLYERRVQRTIRTDISTLSGSVKLKYSSRDNTANSSYWYLRGAFYDKSSYSSNVTVSCALDGTNYETITGVHQFTSTGSIINNKCTGTLAADEAVIISAEGFLDTVL